jgi:TM2 domain-containing membrane protein YozV
LRPVKKHRLAFRKDFHMQRAVIAALLSAFVLPGAGHLYLRRPGRACLFLLPALAALVVVTGEIMKRASSLAAQVLAGTLPLDPAAIAARVNAQGVFSGIGTLALVVLAACWIGSIIDSFIVGRPLDRTAE